MRVFHVRPDGFDEWPALPAGLPDTGYLWVGVTRGEFETDIARLQACLQAWTGGPLVDLHVSDLLNPQLPSHFEDTPWYDVLVFRRLAAGPGTSALFLDDAGGDLHGARRALEAIDTSPVGFAVFDRVLLTVHPADCLVREHFA
ncbi:MAG: magnesium transporter CorA, partial [Caldimonas sp.]